MSRGEPVDDPGNDYFPYAASGLVGVLVCTALTITAGGREAILARMAGARLAKRRASGRAR